MEQTNPAYTIAKVMITFKNEENSKALTKMIRAQLDKCGYNEENSPFKSVFNTVNLLGNVSRDEKYLVHFLAPTCDTNYIRKCASRFLDEFIVDVQDKNQMSKWKEIIEEEEMPIVEGYQILAVHPYEW